MSKIVSPKTGKLINVDSTEFSELLSDPKYRKTILLPSEKLEKIEKARTLPPLSPNMQENEEAAYSPPSPSSSLKGFEMPTNTSLPKLENCPLCPLKIPEQEETPTSQFASIPTLDETLKYTRQPTEREKLERMIREKKYQEGRGIKTRGWKARSPTRGTERHELHEECGDKCFLLPDEEKFPICASLRFGEENKCKVDCGGINSALNRAKQYGYEDVAEKAKFLLAECNKEGLEHFVPESILKSPRIPVSATRGGRMNRSNEYDRHLHREQHKH